MEVNEEGNEEIMNFRKLDVLSHIITLISLQLVTWVALRNV